MIFSENKILGKNVFLEPKIEFWDKNWILGKKLIFWKKKNFWKKNFFWKKWTFEKKWNLEKKINFWEKMSIKKMNFGKKKYSKTTEIFGTKKNI